MKFLSSVCVVLLVVRAHVDAAPADEIVGMAAPIRGEKTLFRRRSSLPRLVERSPQETQEPKKDERADEKKAEKKDEKKDEKPVIKEANQDEKKEKKKGKGRVAKVTEKDPSAKVVRQAGLELAKATKNVDNAVLIIQNPASTPEAIQKAAEDAIKNEEAEDFPREALASASRDPAAAQASLAIIRDKGPIVVGAFQEIAKNPGDKAKVQEELGKITIARLQVVPANFDLIGGSKQGNRRLISKISISPSQTAIGSKISDEAQKKVVEEAQKNLASQTKIVDEQVAVIEKQGAKPEEIEEAAKKALVQEAGEEFAREVLASAASDAKAAMEALAAVRDHGPNQVVAGFKAIAANSKDPAAVKKGLESVITGRKSVVPANLKLIELSGGAASGNQAGAQTTEQKAAAAAPK